MSTYIWNHKLHKPQLVIPNMFGIYVCDYCSWIAPVYNSAINILSQIYKLRSLLTLNIKE